MSTGGRTCSTTSPLAAWFPLYVYSNLRLTVWTPGSSFTSRGEVLKPSGFSHSIVTSIPGRGAVILPSKANLASGQWPTVRSTVTTTAAGRIRGGPLLAGLVGRDHSHAATRIATIPNRTAKTGPRRRQNRDCVRPESLVLEAPSSCKPGYLSRGPRQGGGGLDYSGHLSASVPSRTRAASSLRPMTSDGTHYQRLGRIVTQRPNFRGHCQRGASTRRRLRRSSLATMRQSASYAGGPASRPSLDRILMLAVNRRSG